jgi:aminotransferase
MTDISGFGSVNDISFVRRMIESAGVAAVPGSSFFSDSNAGATLIRFCFCKKYETLEEAGSRLRKFRVTL